MILFITFVCWWVISFVITNFIGQAVKQGFYNRPVTDREVQYVRAISVLVSFAWSWLLWGPNQ